MRPGRREWSLRPSSRKTFRSILGGSVRPSFVNAKIYPKVSGYVLKQNYTDGQEVKTGQLLFQIDPRQYQAALDQSLGQLAQEKADNKKNQQDLARPGRQRGARCLRLLDDALRGGRGSNR